MIIMPTRRTQIVNEITMLEETVRTSTERIESLKTELRDTLPDLLDRDEDAVRAQAIRAKNQFLMDAGLLPKE